MLKVLIDPLSNGSITPMGQLYGEALACLPTLQQSTTHSDNENGRLVDQRIGRIDNAIDELNPAAWHSPDGERRTCIRTADLSLSDRG